ncbi:MAG: hypothetical protein DRP74_02665 [Candidatus Omnitrophota bacterium]|nr:MAG: hypothetical protein DRP74_02665 [Candidatus Omnitrophota bacterium]
MPKVKELANIPYSDWLKRFTIPETLPTTEAQTRLMGLFDAGYPTTGYEGYLNRLTPGSSSLMDTALSRYQGLFDQDYSLADYSQVEKDYLDTVLKEYKKAREEGFEPVKEGLIAENLFGSGPGFQKMVEYGEDTAEGVADISKKWAYEGLRRQMQQQQYMDALKRGDYSTMYNLALSEETRKMTPVLQATQLANMEKEYYDALMRGDIETAFNMGQLLKQSALYPIEQATNYQFMGLNPASGLFGQLQATDLKKYQGEMSAWQTLAQLEANKKESNLGGLGSLLGMGAGALLALPTGGMSVLGGAALGGLLGGGTGSMFQY